MSKQAEVVSTLREINERRDGFANTIRLLYDPTDKSVHLNIACPDNSLDIRVPGEKAMDAFEHPYSYFAAANVAGRLLVKNVVEASGVAA